MQNDKKSRSCKCNYSPYLLNMQENAKIEKKYMIFLIFVLKCFRT